MNDPAPSASAGPVKRKFWVLICALVLGGCAMYYGARLDQLYGPADPARYDNPSLASASVDYERDVKPILNGRCVVCHGCYDSPCQLNLASYQGLTRGANGDKVYDAARLIAAEPTRLFLDAQSNAEWRSKGFQPVLNERAMTPDANRQASVLYRLLKLKQAHPLPAGGPLPDGQFDFSIDRSQSCPAIENLDAFEDKHPDWGMPFGLPGLAEREHNTLAHWVEAGAPYRSPAPLSQEYGERIAQWEAFLNADNLKARLTGRYIYEHWFVGHLYFDDLPGEEFFELVRSTTPPGEPIKVIATRRPYEEPGADRVYYRLRRLVETPLVKTHMPYALNAARLARFKAWFHDAPYTVTALPSYEADTASNPFLTFLQLPVSARYRFMLDEAQFTLMGFIKGPVCRGQMALNVINDHFWVVFEKPDLARDDEDAQFLASELGNLRLPAESESTTRLLKWRSYLSLESKYLTAKSDYASKKFSGSNVPTLQRVWDGDASNPNAALTVFRHFDSASVVQGLIGDRPQTVLFIGYPLLERLHYLLVAGYDVYGNVGHQLATRMYMDFLRMEGEMNFLALLPRAARQPVRDHWYRDAEKAPAELLQDTKAYFPHETGIRYRTDDPLTELYAMLKTHVAPVSSARYALASSGLSGAPLRELNRLSALRGRAVSYLPETALLTVRDAQGRDFYFTMISNSAYSNVAELLNEDKRRLPDEDDLLVTNGFIGAYPNAFFLVNSTELPAFVDAAGRLKSEADYQALLTRHGIRRTDPRFWAHSDELHLAYHRWAAKEAGIFDYNRFENR
jgi:hypothetical protein